MTLCPFVSRSVSLATVQRSLGDPAITYPLWPSLTAGCPRTSTATISYPVEVAFDYARGVGELFERRVRRSPRRCARSMGSAVDRAVAICRAFYVRAV